MRNLTVFLGILLCNPISVAQEDGAGSKFYDIEIIEIVEAALATDVYLPSQIAQSLENLAQLRKNGEVVLQESLRFSAMENRQTKFAFGASVNSVQGVLERAGRKIVNYVQMPTGTEISITVTPRPDKVISVQLWYQARRVKDQPKEDEPLTFSETELSTSVEMKLSVLNVLLARSAEDRRFILITVKPQ